MMRWLTLLAAVVVLAGCDRATSLNQQLKFDKTAFDIRPASPSTPNVYEAVAVVRDKVDVAVLKRDLLQQAATRVKQDGYDMFVLDGPTGVKLTRTTSQYGREIGRSEYPGLKYVLTGYKSGQPGIPPRAVNTESFLASNQMIKPGVTN